MVTRFIQPSSPDDWLGCSLPNTLEDVDLITQAFAIADSSARSEIECNCNSAGPREGGGWWWNTRLDDLNFQEDIDRSLRYLEARGLLVRHPEQPHLVSFNEKS